MGDDRLCPDRWLDTRNAIERYPTITKVRAKTRMGRIHLPFRRILLDREWSRDAVVPIEFRARPAIGQ
jgi:hypothetical protein